MKKLLVVLVSIVILSVASVCNASWWYDFIHSGRDTEFHSCWSCGGSGKCQECDGSGFVEEYDRDLEESQTEICSECHGSGDCSSCGGSGGEYY